MLRSPAQNKADMGFVEQQSQASRSDTYARDNIQLSRNYFLIHKFKSRQLINKSSSFINKK